MQFKIQLIAFAENGEKISAKEIATLKKGYKNIEQLGLCMKESKEILKSLQENIVQNQVNAYVEDNNCCQICNIYLKKKGHNEIKFRTLFGKLSIESPRFKNCKCIEQRAVSFSPLPNLINERVSPELQFMESKWASLISYGMTVKILKDFLPVCEKLNAVTVRNKTLEIAKRSENNLGEEQGSFIDGCPRDWDALPKPDGPIIVGIDGGYVRNWVEKKKNFEVITGKSIPSIGPPKYFGFVQRYDEKPKRRLFEMLKSQGMQHNQKIIFLSDGEEAISWLQRYLNPNACHVLDWFHLTMRITVLLQYAKGLINIDPDIGENIRKDIESAKWNLWHGRPKRAYSRLWSVESLIYNFEETYHKFKKLKKAVEESMTYIKRNSPMIPNYGKIWRAGFPISTAFVESTVNLFISKRFAKKQQMQWTKEGIHLLMQIRAKTFNGELVDHFKQRYPDFTAEKTNIPIPKKSKTSCSKETVEKVYTFEYQDKGALKYWLLPDDEELELDETITEEVRKAFDLFSQVAEIFLDNKVDDDFDFLKIKEQVLEKFPQEEIKNASDTIKQYTSAS